MSIHSLRLFLLVQQTDSLTCRELAKARPLRKLPSCSEDQLAGLYYHEIHSGSCWQGKESQLQLLRQCWGNVLQSSTLKYSDIFFSDNKCNLIVHFSKSWICIHSGMHNVSVSFWLLAYSVLCLWQMAETTAFTSIHIHLSFYYVFC